MEIKLYYVSYQIKDSCVIENAGIKNPFKMPPFPCFAPMYLEVAFTDEVVIVFFCNPFPTWAS